MSRKKILITAGEPSGDIHASNLVRDLKASNPDIEFFGLGGSLMKKAGVDVLFDIAKLALVGIIEVLTNIFTVRKAFRLILRKIDSEKTDLAILVDYPGFNLRLAKELKKRSIPVVYYISPQVWAWGADRIGIIRDYVKKILVFFKFEEELYKKHGVNAEFVGHPLVDIVRASSSRTETLKRYGLAAEEKTVALLPGSRTMEIETLLPIMAKAANIMTESLKRIQFIVAKHPDLPASLYKAALENARADIAIADGDTYNVLAAADFAVVASGTATLETAIIGTPFIVTYRTNPLTFALGWRFIKVRFVGLVNILAGRAVAPEFLQSDATPEKIAAKALELLGDEGRLASMREELRIVKNSLGPPGATDRAAASISSLLSAL